MTDFPATPEALTADWLSEALGFPVDDFEVARFAEGSGIIGMVTRVLLGTAPGNPRSVIAKFPSPNPTNRAIADTYDMYGREVMFYRSIADKVDIRAPRCFFAAIDGATGDFVLLLEDLGHLRIGDRWPAARWTRPGRCSPRLPACMPAPGGRAGSPGSFPTTIRPSGTA